MRLEGRRRQAAFKDSRWLDVLEYGVLRDEYVEKFGDPSGPGEE
jgi:RimJ/RimL family protein N-acetyltransferase